MKTGFLRAWLPYGILVICICWAGAAMANPPGSYTETCRNIQTKGENLSAECKRMDGTWKVTELEFATTCVGVISNVDGTLACTGPVGSFARTCRDTRVEGQTVYSTCRTISGSWKETSSHFSGYLHPLTNCDGNLVDRPNCR